MKLKTLMAAGVLALAGAITASAQTTIVITGSTAFRSQTHAAIQNLLNAGYTFKYTGTAGVSGANASVFVGTVPLAPAGSNPFTIKCSWSGSAAGVQTVAATGTPITVGTLIAGVDGAEPAATVGGTPSAVDPRTTKRNPEIPHIAMSDNTQTSTPFNGVVARVPAAGAIVAPGDHPGNTFNALLQARFDGTNRGAVGVVPFRWVCSLSGPAGAAAPTSGLNMTTQLAQYIYTGTGAAPLSMFTGLPADRIPNVKTVYGLGRDPDSGTRINAYAESGIGALNFGVKQYQILTTAAGAITSIDYVPQSTVNGYIFGPGVGGESSGGTLATKMRNSGPAAGLDIQNLGEAGFCVSYLGINDVTALTAGWPASGKTMTWNGIDYTENNVIEGQYTFWGYERLLYRTTLGTETDANGLGTNKVAYGDLLAKTLYNAVSTLNIFDMQVQRAIDGGNVTSKNF